MTSHIPLAKPSVFARGGWPMHMDGKNNLAPLAASASRPIVSRALYTYIHVLVAKALFPRNFSGRRWLPLRSLKLSGSLGPSCLCYIFSLARSLSTTSSHLVCSTLSLLSLSCLLIYPRVHLGPERGLSSYTSSGAKS